MPHRLRSMKQRMPKHQKKMNIMKKNVWEAVLRIVIAALTAALTAIGTTSCMSWAGVL